MRKQRWRTLTVVLGTILLLLPGLYAVHWYRQRFVQPTDWPRIDTFRPPPLIKVHATDIRRAKYPVFDTHIHLGWSGLTAEDVIAIMDSCNVRKVLDLEIYGRWGEELRRHLDEYGNKFPDRIVTACNIDFTGIGEPDYAEKAVQQLEQSYEMGARAVKVWRNLGMDVRDKDGKRVSIDDPRLDPIWSKAGELDMPVIFHIADPTAYWYPPDNRNERFLALQAKLRPWGHKWAFPWGPLFHTVRTTLEPPIPKIRLVRHPELLYYAANVYPDPLPHKETLIRQRDNVIRRHPETTFIGAHMGCCAEDLEWIGKELDEMPNYYVDISISISELGRQPYTARKFLIKYQDRILFGLDGPPDIKAYRQTFRFLETYDEYFDYPWRDRLPQGEWKIYGVALPDSVLRKIYYLNAERVFGVAK